ncbi:class I adenylate-forming enzyme family protein [Paludibacterium purpuratum]|uniref:Acyl-CoA synthetase (AMP-forming)/AMP-acid ligase II n=1 Tax=Paludibacterium purpuratum TaxID=1144873 RepID=A0A4V6PZ89_9NEIS|nr:class I adenylate-forming enzyme family protein [Paludibacterium purpuratum]TDR79759.1 acyl-CoA synthetase (AMP-forming)/AMP-acid ligase II [Paludibacterium purpuratum]
MSYFFATLAFAALGYLIFAFIHLGFPGRLTLLARWDDRIDTVLETAVRRHGLRELIELARPMHWIDRRVWTAGQLLDTVDALSACWHSLGVEPGDRVAIYKANDFDYFLFSAAAIRLGAIAVPMNANVPPETAGLYLSRVGASLLITDCANWARVRPYIPACVHQAVLADGPAPTTEERVYPLTELLRQAPRSAPRVARGSADPLYIVHTSGTTGVPKGVILKSEGIAQSLRSIVLFNLVSPRDLACFALPLNHQVSQLYLHGTLLMGMRCIVNGDLDAQGLLWQLEQRQPSVFFGFPITYTRLMIAGATKRALASVRIWGTTADASHEVQQRAFLPKGSFFRRLGLPVDGSLFIDGLGSSEVGIAALLRITTPWTRHFDRRVGRKTPLGPQIKVADSTGRPVVKGRPGLLMIKGRSMFGGYWNAHDVLYAASRDGWWFTGDVVRQGEDGEMIHLDREVDVIHTRNGPVYTLPLEERLLKCTGVLDVSVFGVRQQPDAQEEPAAVVALNKGAAPVAPYTLLQAINRQMAPEQHLSHLWIIPWEEFPIGATGKTLKRHLRERYNAHLQASFSTTEHAACNTALATE